MLPSVALGGSSALLRPAAPQPNLSPCAKLFELERLLHTMQRQFKPQLTNLELALKVRRQRSVKLPGEGWNQAEKASGHHRKTTGFRRRLQTIVSSYRKLESAKLLVQTIIFCLTNNRPVMLIFPELHHFFCCSF